MTETIIALFDDITAARQVVEDLVKADFARNSISLITNDAHNQYVRYLDKDYVPKDDAVTAVQGAGFGAAVGVLTGLLVGLAALTIPGIGLAIVAGPIVAGITGAVAGAITGGIVGALVKSGVPEDEAPYYAEGIRRGGTLISLQTSDTLRAKDIMNRYGAINIHERINVWRQDGWKGFNAEAESTVEPVVEKPTQTDHTDTVKSPPTAVTTSIPEVQMPIVTETVTTKSSTLTHHDDPLTVAPVEQVVEEPTQTDHADTVKSLPVAVMTSTPDTTI